MNDNFILRLMIQSIRAAASSVVATSDMILEFLNSNTDTDERPNVTPAQPQEPNCAEGRHPESSLRNAPVMGHPTRKVCVACRGEVEGQ